MNIYVTKCKNCNFCIKSKTLFGMKYICSKTNKKVNKNYYCGKVKPFKVDLSQEVE